MNKKQIIKSIELQGLEGKIVTIESNYRKGFNQFRLIGLVNKAITEAKERVTIALSKLRFGYPYGSYIVNLLPSSINKSGAYYDLAIAISILINTKIKVHKEFLIEHSIFVGELALTGEIRTPDSIWAIIRASRKLGIKRIYTGLVNNQIIDIKKLGIEIIEYHNLNELVNHIETGVLPVKKTKKNSNISINNRTLNDETYDYIKSILSCPSFSEVLAICAIGRHNLLVDGPPGVGKTSFLQKLNLLLPNFNEYEILDALAINSIAQLFRYSDKKQLVRPKLAKPSYTISASALLGGGNPIRPGLVTKYTNGVLFLDEISEFKQSTIDLLRDPLETNVVRIERVKQVATFPVKIQLIIARNPCPCGFFETEEHEKCICNFSQIKKYRAKISGAILDRIDIKYKLEKSSWDRNLNKPIKDKDVYDYWKRLVNAQNYSGKIIWSNKLQELQHKILFNQKLSYRSAIKIRNIAESIAKLNGTNQITEEIYFKAVNLN
jgi:magnesium chelatase family protein